jgi:hypothetical protein
VFEFGRKIGIETNWRDRKAIHDGFENDRRPMVLPELVRCSGSTPWVAIVSMADAEIEPSAERSLARPKSRFWRGRAFGDKYIYGFDVATIPCGK